MKLSKFGKDGEVHNLAYLGKFFIIRKMVLDPFVASWAIHCKKSFTIFPSPAGMLLTKLSLGGNYDVKYKLFLPRESSVSDIPAGDGNIEKLFLRCRPTAKTISR